MTDFIGIAHLVVEDLRDIIDARGNPICWPAAFEN